MLEDKILCDLFHYSQDQIRALRNADETFDAICKDYLSLYGEISHALTDKNSKADRFLTDARDSLSGLTQEIEMRLRRFCSTDPSDT